MEETGAKQSAQKITLWENDEKTVQTDVIRHQDLFSNH